MKTRRKLLPGQPGTKKLLQKYGSDLVCVRYRYDEATLTRYKTVELIEEQNVWEKNSNRIPGHKICCLKISFHETDLRSAVKDAGGRWNVEHKVWELKYKEIAGLGLTDRIVKR